jgi:hypothetical protein
MNDLAALSAALGENRLPGDVTIGRALHNDALKIDGKIFAFFQRDRLVVKLPADRVRALVASGAEPFTSGGRTMREWVAVKPRTAAEQQRLALDAAKYVATCAKKS